MTGMFRTVALALCLGAMLIAGCADVSEENYDKIEVGMRIGDVQAIMGTDGTREELRGFNIGASGISGASSTAHRDETYTWKSGDREIVVQVRNGIVVSKNRRGF
jgi:hypothetical protein